jgi:hypothetical protein
VKRPLSARSVLLPVLALVAITMLPDASAPGDQGASRSPTTGASSVAPLAATLSTVSVLRSDQADNLRQPTRTRSEFSSHAAGLGSTQSHVALSATTAGAVPAARLSIASLRWNTWLRAPPAMRR